MTDLDEDLERVKWYLWHGNVFHALQVLDCIEIDLDTADEEAVAADKLAKLATAVREFHGYIETNRPFIPNYGERQRYGEPISTAFAESTVNGVVSKRMVKKQQMRWTPRGAHLLLQVRTETLNGDLRETFERWYPAIAHAEEPILMAA